MNSLRDKEEQYKYFLNYQQPKTQKNGVKNLFSFIGVAVFAFICALIFYSTFINVPRVDTEGKNIAKVDKIELKKEKKKFNISLFSRRQNLLILGVDSNGENTDPFISTRSDTILLANLDPSNHSINVISIPRDSKVYLADGKGVQKINHAHAIGGIELTKKTIEETLGIKIDHYIVINSKAIRELVDVIGGITVYVEKPLNYDDYAGKLHIHLQKGTHKLNGEQVEGFLRFRHDGLGDIGRTSRQQWFLKSLIEAIQTPSVIPRIPEALRLAMTYIKTDMSLYELSHLAVYVRDINMDSLEVATLPGGPSTKGYISYWILDPEKVQEMVDRMIYRVKPEKIENLSVGIMYNEKNEETMQIVKDKFEQMGIDVSCVGKGRLPHSQIIAHKKGVTIEEITKLKRKIPQLHNMQFVYDPNRQYCLQSDFTVIFSDN